jgi:hypothetical protein
VRRAIPFLVVAALLAGSCAEEEIPRATAASLQDQVAEIRTFLENGQVFAARQRLERLTNTVNRLLDGEKLDSGTALEILAAVDDVEASLELAPERSPVAEPTTPPPPPEDEGDEGDEGEQGNAYGNDKDKGGGHGDEGHGNDD